jgi:hypothetical protein
MPFRPLNQMAWNLLEISMANDIQSSEIILNFEDADFDKTRKSNLVAVGIVAGQG